MERGVERLPLGPAGMVGGHADRLAADLPMRRTPTVLSSVALTVLCLALLAACGGGHGSSGLRDRTIARFKQAGVSLHEQGGLYAGGDDTQLVPDSRHKFGDFVVHILKRTHGFAIAEGSAGPPGSDGVRWDDTLANHRPPYYTSFKRYGPSLELQSSSGVRSTRQAQWQQLDAILSQLIS